MAFITFELPDQLKKDCKKKAEEEKRGLSDWLRLVLEDCVKKEGE